MENLFRVNTKLVILGINLENSSGQISVVSTLPKECSLPVLRWKIDRLNLKDINEKASTVTGLHSTWLKLKLVDCIRDDKDEVSIVYVAWVPLDTVLSSHFWMPVDAIEDDDLRMLITRTIQQL